MNKIQKIKGMKDFTDKQSKKLKKCIEIIINVVENFGFSYIKTPHIEDTSLFTHSAGSSSDIVKKEMYSFKDKSDNSISLRPEGTAGIVRSYIENGFDKQSLKKRVYYCGEMYRYERPQKGRYREFIQFGCESFGFNDIREDITLLIMASSILKSLDIKSKLEINSIGSSEFRKEYINDILIPFLNEHINSICDDCKARKDTNPIRIFDCKNSKCKTIYSNVSKIYDNLPNIAKENFNRVIDSLKKHNILYEINSSLVRGLDYYNDIVYEFTTEKLGTQNAIIGGGRYDNLISKLQGDNTPAVGFAIGIDRLLELYEYSDDVTGIYFGALDSEAVDTIFNLIYKEKLTTKVYLEYKAKSHTKHLNNANKLGYKYCCIISSSDISDNNIRVKNLKSNSETIYKSIGKIEYV